jgi:serine/threonine protein kinase
VGFAIKSRLGRGRSVESFAATLDVEGERFAVVVKRPRAEFKQNQSFAEALIAWGDAQREIDQENVVAVLEAGKTDEGAYVLQELVEGAPLSGAIQMLRRRKRTLMPSLAIGIAHQIAVGLAYLHKKGIVHGSLDTGDVMLSYGGDVKIGDQRLHTLDRHLRDLEVEQDPYRAPEVSDVASATKESDVYALGLITLEMLIGTTVWTADSMTVEGSVAALKDFTHVGQAQPALTDDVVRFLDACLAKDPRRRCSTSDAAKQIDGLIAKHGIREAKNAIGDFVKALIPPPESDAAPTQMVDQERAEEIAREHSARLLHFEGKSVPLDPDLEKKALTRAVRLPSHPPEPIKPLPKPAPSAISAPSISRARAQSIPNLAKVAAKSSLDFEWSSERVKMIGAGAALLLLLVLSLLIFGGEDARPLRMRISSVPEGADVFVDGDAIGATPIDQEVEVDDSTIQLRFKLNGYRDHQVTIGTDAAELRYEAPLEKLE